MAQFSYCILTWTSADFISNVTNSAFDKIQVLWVGENLTSVLRAYDFQQFTLRMGQRNVCCNQWHHFDARKRIISYPNSRQLKIGYNIHTLLLCICVRGTGLGFPNCCICEWLYVFSDLGTDIWFDYFRGAWWARVQEVFFFLRSFFFLGGGGL